MRSIGCGGWNRIFAVLLPIVKGKLPATHNRGLCYEQLHLTPTRYDKDMGKYTNVAIVLQLSGSQANDRVSSLRLGVAFKSPTLARKGGVTLELSRPSVQQSNGHSGHTDTHTHTTLFASESVRWSFLLFGFHRRFRDSSRVFLFPDNEDDDDDVGRLVVMVKIINNLHNKGQPLPSQMLRKREREREKIFFVISKVSPKSQLLVC